VDHFKQTKELYENTIRPITKYCRHRRTDIILNYVCNKNVLDIGCVEHESSIEQKSNWWLHGLIKNKAANLLGVDYDTAAIEELRKKGYNVCVANVEEMNLGCKYDVIVAGEVFEHLTNHRSFLESVKRHLTDNGILVASMPNANSLNYFIQTLVFGHEVDAWDHSSFFTPVTLTVMLKKCGLTPTEIILYQPDEIFHHENEFHHLAAYLFNKFQQMICWLRPSLSRGLIVVAQKGTI